jgi:hypothetical protein
LGAKSAQDPEIFRSKSSKPHAGQQDQKSDGHYFKLRALTMESPRITNKVHITSKTERKKARKQVGLAA